MNKFHKKIRSYENKSYFLLKNLLIIENLTRAKFNGAADFIYLTA